MMSLPSDRLPVRPYAAPQESQCEWHIQVCEAVLSPAFDWREVASPTTFKKTKTHFEDNKIQSQFMLPTAG